jgi:hypothetical protein
MFSSISHHIDNLEDYANFLLASKQIDNGCAYEKKQRILRLRCPILDMICTFPDKEWDWVKISGHKSITCDIVISNQKFPWVPSTFYRKSFGATLEIMRDNMDFPWDKNHISSLIDINKKQDQELVINNPVIDWDWYSFSQDIEDLDFIRKTSGQDWRWGSFYSKKCVTWDFILEFADKNWNWNLLSMYKDEDWSFVLKHPELPWDWYSLGTRGVPFEIVSSLKTCPWNFRYLSSWHPLSDIIFHPTEFPWNWKVVSLRKDLTKNIIMKNVNIPWDFKIISDRLCNGML